MLRKSFQKIYWNINSFIWDDYLTLTDLKSELELLADYLKEKLGKDKAKILDLGCATGYLSLMLAQKGFDVIGLDFSTRMINKAERKLNSTNSHKLKFILNDINRGLIFPENEFDLVICRRTFRVAEDNELFLNKLHQICKKDALIFVVDKFSGHNKKKKYKKNFIHRFILLLRPLVYPTSTSNHDKNEFLDSLTKKGFTLLDDRSSEYNCSFLFSINK